MERTTWLDPRYSKWKYDGNSLFSTDRTTIIVNQNLSMGRPKSSRWVDHIFMLCHNEKLNKGALLHSNVKHILLFKISLFDDKLIIRIYDHLNNIFCRFICIHNFNSSLMQKNIVTIFVAKAWDFDVDHIIEVPYFSNKTTW